VELTIFVLRFGLALNLTPGLSLCGLEWFF